MMMAGIRDNRDIFKKISNTIMKSTNSFQEISNELLKVVSSDHICTERATTHGTNLRMRIRT